MRWWPICCDGLWRGAAESWPVTPSVGDNPKIPHDQPSTLSMARRWAPYGEAALGRSVLGETRGLFHALATHTPSVLIHARAVSRASSIVSAEAHRSHAAAG